MISTLTVHGLRGFATPQTLTLARPDGSPGSGLTFIVGSNNAGKSTIVEAFRAVIQRQTPSFAQGRRNLAAGDRIELKIVDDSGGSTTLRSVDVGSSETEFVHDNKEAKLTQLLVLSSRRYFDPYFGKSESDRNSYMAHIGFPPLRTATVQVYTYRLFRAQKNKAAFNALLGRILDPVPNWSIDQTDAGQYFLKFVQKKGSHSSEGLGEGLVSLFFLVDALYDSVDGDTIVIDEPELSLHPALQKKVAALFIEYSATRQIVVATHSPYFVDMPSLGSGAQLVRVRLEGESSLISELGDNARNFLGSLAANMNNPHVFGLSAREVFFLEDHVVLLEGQEDVVFYRVVEEDLKLSISGTYFGWGVGGAENMSNVAMVLSDLGFKKVVGLLDHGKDEVVAKLSAAFPHYRFFAIAAPDVRTKGAVNAKAGVSGLLDDANQRVRDEYRDQTRELLTKVNAFLSS